MTGRVGTCPREKGRAIWIEARERARDDLVLRAERLSRGGLAIEARRLRTAANALEMQVLLERSEEAEETAARLQICGSTGSTTARSRSQPSFSSFKVWMATAFAFASRSGRA